MTFSLARVKNRYVLKGKIAGRIVHLNAIVILVIDCKSDVLDCRLAIDSYHLMDRGVTRNRRQREVAAVNSDIFIENNPSGDSAIAKQRYSIAALCRRNRARKRSVLHFANLGDRRTEHDLVAVNNKFRAFRYFDCRLINNKITRLNSATIGKLDERCRTDAVISRRNNRYLAGNRDIVAELHAADRNVRHHECRVGRQHHV